MYDSTRAQRHTCRLLSKPEVFANLRIGATNCNTEERILVIASSNFTVEILHRGAANAYQTYHSNVLGPFMRLGSKSRTQAHYAGQCLYSTCSVSCLNYGGVRQREPLHTRKELMEEVYIGDGENSTTARIYKRTYYSCQ